ncbi:ABC transporter substrate-binding protein [Actinomadura sp. 7K507]|uniref:ABC transporter substrate-binding protein n=1 Tax=Actinomadura sp. 7K507 TaxID=2530365 RepID=UPI0014044BB2|nr:ABC transporter substrate-binding protein [Actinomadura sp. 7K507]
MFTRKLRPLTAAVVLGVAAVSACSAPGQAEQPAEGFPSEIRIGVPLDTSGPVGPVVEIGLSEREGIRVAAEEINESGLLGDSKIVLTESDTAANRDEAVKAVTQYVDKGVHGIVGFTLTPSFAAAAPVAQRTKIPVVAVGLSGGGVEETGDLAFRTYPNVATTVYPPADVTFAKDFGAKTAGLIYASDNDSSVAINKARKEALEKAGVKVVENVAIGSQDTELRAALTKLKGASPDLVVASTTPGQVPAFASQAAEVGLDSRMITVDGTQTPATLKAAGTELQCAVFQAVWSDISTKGNNEHFLKEFDKRSEREPDTFAAASYDGLWVLARAMKDADSTQSGKVRDALLKIKDHQGALGTYDYTQGTGAPTLSGEPMIIDGGKAKAYESGQSCTA